MKIIEDIGGGILLLQMPEFSDERGRFIKLADKRLQEIRYYEQRQLNYVVNHQKFTCRGLHYQKGAFAESKIFRVLTGAMQAVAFNVQPGDLHYKRTFTAILDRPGIALWVPRGYATGYCTLEEHTSVLYSSDNDYQPEAEAGLRWDDPLLKIHHLPFGNLVLSAKDMQWPDFNNHS